MRAFVNGSDARVVQKPIVDLVPLAVSGLYCISLATVGCPRR
jgi:hypothetical protein